MSYFVLNDFPKEKPRGMAKPRTLNSERVRNRSELIGVEAEAIANDNAGGNFIHKKLSPEERTSPRVHAASLAAKNASHDIFGPPISPPRPPRRQPISDEAIHHIYPAPCNKIGDAQDQMARAPTMVEKMVNEENIIPIRKESPNRFALKPVEQADFGNKTMPGFKGMGQQCGPERPKGLATKVTDFSDFTPDLPGRSKPLSPRHRQAEVYNPINGQKSPYYGKDMQK